MNLRFRVYSHFPANSIPQEVNIMVAANMHPKMQQGVVITREAHLALLDLKRLVDTATEEIHAAELETAGMAIGCLEGDDPLRTLRAAAETLRSPGFEAAILQARRKMETAVAWHLTAQDE